MVGRGIDNPHVAPTIASGFGLNEASAISWSKMSQVLLLAIPIGHAGQVVADGAGDADRFGTVPKSRG
jgi:hypothetical protein